MNRRSFLALIPKAGVAVAALPLVTLPEPLRVAVVEPVVICPPDDFDFDLFHGEQMPARAYYQTATERASQAQFTLADRVNRDYVKEINSIGDVVRIPGFDDR